MELVLLVLILVVFSIDAEKMPTGYVVKENPIAEKTNFRTLTKAVCEEKSSNVVCNDMLFAECNGKEFIVNNNENFTCDELKLNLSEVSVKGHGVFKNEWKDLRTE